MSAIETIIRLARFTATELGRVPGRVRERKEYEAWLDKQAEACENERTVRFGGQFN